MHWVYKVELNDKVASDLYFYIDDVRPTAGSTKSSWRATQRVCQMLSFLGLQDAYKKRTVPSQESREWAGTSFDSMEGVVTVFLSDKKWGRSKEIIVRIIIELSDGGRLDFKELEKDRGCLVYISRTYRSILSYLKGIHQTLKSWKSGRNVDG